MMREIQQKGDAFKILGMSRGISLELLASVGNSLHTTPHNIQSSTNR